MYKKIFYVIIIYLYFFQINLQANQELIFTDVKTAEDQELMNKAEVYYDRGWNYSNSGKEENISKAIRDLSTAINIYPKYDKACLVLGIIFLINENDPDQAILEFKKAIEIKKNNPEVYVELGSACSSINKIQEAFKAFDTAIEQNPHYGQAYLLKGGLLAQNKEFDKAISNLNKAILFNPDLAEAHMLRGLSYKSLGKNDLALNDFLKVKSLGNKAADQDINEIRNLVK